MDRIENESQHDGTARSGVGSGPAPLRRARRRRRTLVAAALTLTLVGGASATAAAATTTGPGTGGSGGDGVSGTAAVATPQEERGLVDVTTVLDYGTGRAAGTGLVLTPDGEILTNNHVVAGSTSITVTDVTTGKSYVATVVGTDSTDDVAVLRLQGASGLTPAVLASPAVRATVSPGATVTAVGNAGGTGGTPTAATGSVLALGQTITAADESSADTENLSGMIEVAAAIEAGDSGGPLYADGAVVGMDTAASASSGPSYRTATYSGGSAPTTGYAIPIGAALDIAGQITSGVQNDTIRQSYPAFLGVEMAAGPTGAQASGDESTAGDEGATVSGILGDSPAASAGLSAGDVIVSVDGQAVRDAGQLSATLAAHRVGDQVRLGWLDADGATHTATVTLAAGPAS
jgi:S1-C subfamily serine protease